MSNAPGAAEPQAPAKSVAQVEIDRDEVLARARQHPVAGPYVEVIIRDLMMGALAQQLRETQEQLAAATGQPAQTTTGTKPRPGAKPQRTPRKRAAASASPAE
ncbi:hypothetical protein [Blastococcus sp. CCUG 61487]|uniref:hypothetical protein n=1 Tax=Blastococcus sp. CCUG 61487 TaxID=1840703 RepID=UPI0010C1388D|nr:hypothetical protein [Blastococcus sp. CCUG 61487]TKJ25211.1 hypothetical protein A6V29_04100 [Blastococcus sp. CCUG 61487]